MKLLLVNYEYPPLGGGAATATQAIARALVALHHVPHVLTASYRELRGSTIEDGIHIHRIPALRSRAEACSVTEMASFLGSALSRVRSLVRQHRIEGIVAFFSFPCGPVAWAADRPYVVSLRGGDVPGAEPSLARTHALLAPIRRRVLKDALAVVANSEGLRGMAESADPVPVQVIPNGVDTVFFHPAETSSPPARPFRWLFVGRFQAQKNLAWLLRQMASLRPVAPPFTLDLVGDGPLRDTLVKQAAELGLADIVRWHGWKPRAELRSMYQAADALINPSLYEGMPNTVLEAMACGLPVLASRVAGNDTVVTEGTTGALFDLGDEGTFGERARQWMNARELPARLGQAGRARTEQDYSWTNTASRYLGLFGAPAKAATDSAAAGSPLPLPTHP